MAQRFVALLRGINVGRAKRVAMADLRALIESLGYRDVRTLLNSGNVVFTGDRAGASAAATAAARIEAALASKLELVSRVTVLTAAELEAAIDAMPLAKVAKDPSRLLVAVLADPADLVLIAPLARRDWRPGALALGKRVAYLWCPDGQLASPHAEALGKTLRDGVTTRNWATMTKLLELTRSGEPAAAAAKQPPKRRG